VVWFQGLGTIQALWDALLNAEQRDALAAEARALTWEQLVEEIWIFIDFPRQQVTHPDWHSVVMHEHAIRIQQRKGDNVSQEP
jgi:hypothetical protein